MTAGDDRLIGRTLGGRFVVRERIGAGGMGRVYRAWQASVGRDVAIKVVDERLAGDRAVARRFLREAHLSSRLSHPNTVAVHDFGQDDDGTLYLVMELLAGPTLQSALRGGALRLDRAIGVAMQLCDALSAAHAAGVVHRDLKPSNILLADDPGGRDVVKVLDFGLARSIDEDDPGSPITSTSVIVGTPHYMAPELIAGKAPTPASDLYALGCVLFELVVGRPPFAPATGDAVYRMHLDTAPTLDRVPPSLRDLLAALLAKSPADRPPSAAAVRAALEAARRAADAAESPSDASEPYAALNVAERTPPSDNAATRVARVPVAAPAAGRRSRAVPGVLVVFALAAIGAAAWLILRDRSSRAAPTAQPVTAIDAAASTPEVAVDAGAPPAPLDAAAAPVEAEPATDAAARPERIRKPAGDRVAKPRVDAGAPSSSPPRGKDAGADFVLPD